MKVELITPPTEITDASIKQYLADCVMVVRNKQPKNNDKLFDRLMKEAYGNKPSRVFEYIPCKIENAEEFVDGLSQAFGFKVFDDYYETFDYYTTARELLNVGVTWENVLKLVDFTYYTAVKITAPYFLYGQASTHNQITSVSHSNRYTDADLGYWIPHEIREYYETRGKDFGIEYSEERLQLDWNNRVETTPPYMLEDIMKKQGVKRREVYARGRDMLAYRVYTLGGYTNNPNAWPHFINQRFRDSHTQKEMRDLAAMIEEVIS